MFYFALFQKTSKEFNTQYFSFHFVLDPLEEFSSASSSDSSRSNINNDNNESSNNDNINNSKIDLEVTQIRFIRST